MDWITDLDALHSHYGTPAAPAMRKVTDSLTPSYRAFIERSRFCVLSTVGPEGTDGSPRGDQGPVVTVADRQTLLLPDWKGNERIDSLRNILRDGRVSLYFMVPGSTISVRVNGTARLTADAALCARFERDGRHPRTVIVIRVAEVYSQCARALQRSALWTSGDCSEGLPSVGQMLEEATRGDIDGAAYDAERATRAHLGWW
ncbi:MSMEG_1061 family FMN-dependent PPOX-type flavoprotein [Neotabrizicola shimadae]|uniref:Pyridoxamine 5'-phosphate oxidase family protein n=1 Tax=Neotabrizicola shimadae TaxID=2807096 RepID=A0A8G0ZVY4_9RHOB|nr:MSMEG_1061 family FMN-dependent PPOX-type flavoprotein [Neotabrizicola shimadae]QYZ69009.1 pyridoxamine 5'-phosphate oxidase family protein [Neotabrizicola shimadae]